MAEDNIKEPEEGQAVESVTEETPHPADEDSSPGPYTDLEINRPPVSTNEPDTPIAHSLVGGAGAPSPQVTPPEEQGQPEAEEPAPTPQRGRPPKESKES
jgi:hypothetical protein